MTALVLCCRLVKAAGFRLRLVLANRAGLVLDASWGHRSAVSTRKGGGFYGYKDVDLELAGRDPGSELPRRVAASPQLPRLPADHDGLLAVVRQSGGG